MKNIINIVLYQLIAFLAINAQPNIDMNQYDVSIGETFTATIEVKPNDLSIGVIELNVLYNDAFIKVKDTETGNNLSGYFNNNTSGVILFSAINAQGLTNNFTALSITFEVIGSATLTSNIEIDINKLTDPNGTPLTYNKTDGVLNINQLNCIDYLFVGNKAGKPELIANGVYQAAEHIESNGIIGVNSKDVIFKSGEKIDLLTGFEVKKPASFSIKLEGCETE